MKKGFTFLSAVFATILLLLSCRRAIREEFPAGGMNNNVSEPQEYMPDVTGIVRTFNVIMPISNKTEQVIAEVKGGFIVVEGDIILAKLPGAGESDPVTEAVGIDASSSRWPNSVIYYVIPGDHPKKADIEWAINRVGAATNLCFVPRTTEDHYLRFVSGNGCASYVGRTGGCQDVIIGNCSRGSITHEILHAAGLWHEQSREDRDNYVTINWENIADSKKNNFNKRVSDGIDIGPYNYGSIMHYSAKAFSKNGKNTIDIKIPPGTPSTFIGQQSSFTALDKAAINSMYKMGPCKSTAGRPFRAGQLSGNDPGMLTGNFSAP